MPKVAAADDFGFVGREHKVGLVGLKGHGRVVGAVGGMTCRAVEAGLAGGGGEDDEVADVELGGEGGAAEAEDAAGAWEMEIRGELTGEGGKRGELDGV